MNIDFIIILKTELNLCAFVVLGSGQHSTSSYTAITMNLSDM